MDASSILNSFQPAQCRSGIAGLVRDILVLDERLKAPDDQSEYFRWGIEAHRDHLDGLRLRYTKIREEFNSHNVNQFEDEIAAQILLMEKYARLNSRFIRQIVRSSAQRIIQEMDDMIALKSITDHLPTISELKNEPELLEALFET